MQRCLRMLTLGLGVCALSWGGLAAGPPETPPDESQAEKSQADDNEVQLLVPDKSDASDENDKARSEVTGDQRSPDAAAAETRRDEAGESIQLVDPAAKDLLERISYVFGLDIGQEIKQRGVALDLDLLFRGIKDGMEGTPAVSAEEINVTKSAFGAMRLAERKALGEKNKKEEEKFLAANRKKRGVKALPSGLQYRVLKSGNGRSPRLTDRVSVHYRGKLIDGTEFENSYEMGQPVELPIQSFIPGCKEALPLMREGDKWELVVPSRLAFAEQGDPRNTVIGPNAALLYEIELVAVVSGTNRPAAQ